MYLNQSVKDKMSRLKRYDELGRIRPGNASRRTTTIIAPPPPPPTKKDVRMMHADKVAWSRAEAQRQMDAVKRDAADLDAAKRCVLHEEQRERHAQAVITRQSSKRATAAARRPSSELRDDRRTVTKRTGGGGRREGHRVREKSAKVRFAGDIGRTNKGREGFAGDMAEIAKQLKIKEAREQNERKKSAAKNCSKPSQKITKRSPPNKAEARGRRLSPAKPTTSRGSRRLPPNKEDVTARRDNVRSRSPSRKRQSFVEESTFKSTAAGIGSSTNERIEQPPIHISMPSPHGPPQQMLAFGTLSLVGWRERSDGSISGRDSLTGERVRSAEIVRGVLKVGDTVEDSDGNTYHLL